MSKEKETKPDVKIYERALKNVPLEFMTIEGRRKALAVIAEMCIYGYKVETVGGRSDKVIEITQKNPNAAIRAINELHKMAPETTSQFEVNFLERSPDDKKE